MHGLIESTRDIIELIDEIKDDLNKVVNNNKIAAQRVRAKSVELEKLFKAHRKLSLDMFGLQKNRIKS